MLMEIRYAKYKKTMYFIDLCSGINKSQIIAL